MDYQSTTENLKQWSLARQVFIDVRAPIEFEQGHIPNSINAPILTDEERALIGLTYKQKGRDEAVKLGYETVSGENKSFKVNRWKEILQAHPDAVFTCFRGGMRSQISRQWMREAGVDRPLVQGGYKGVRQILIETLRSFPENFQFLLLSGPTGAGKTHFLKKISQIWPTVDLEDYAEHRGSAFGAMSPQQPTQAVFENRLAWGLLQNEDLVRNENLALMMEDESRLIGRCVQPETYFQKLRASPVLWLDVPLDARVENTFFDYISSVNVTEELFSKYKKSLFKIKNRLGGLRYQVILSQIESCESSWKSRCEVDENRVWIRSLLVHYYDPLYFGSLEKRNPTILLKAAPDYVFDFLVRQKSTSKDSAVRAKANPT